MSEERKRQGEETNKPTTYEKGRDEMLSRLSASATVPFPSIRFMERSRSTISEEGINLDKEMALVQFRWTSERAREVMVEEGRASKKASMDSKTKGLIRCRL
jgi:hypothetical protein